MLLRRTATGTGARLRLRQPWRTAVTAQAVKELREKSGAPMMDCKKALAATDGSMAAAIDWLRAKGIARASSGADRVALEGLVGLHINAGSTQATLVEINSETDFVSRNKDFQAFCAGVVAAAASSGAADATALLSAPFPLASFVATSGTSSSGSGGTQTVRDALGDVISLIRENIVLKRVSRVTLEEAAGGVGGGMLAGYVHGRVGEGLGPSSHAAHTQLGKTAAVVTLSTAAPSPSPSPKAAPTPPKSSAPAPAGEAVAAGGLEQIGRRLAMHVVAAKPQFLSPAEVPDSIMQREAEIFRQQSLEMSAGAAKSPEVVDKIIRGKVLKRMSEVRWARLFVFFLFILLFLCHYFSSW